MRDVGTPVPMVERVLVIADMAMRLRSVVPVLRARGLKRLGADMA